MEIHNGAESGHLNSNPCLATNYLALEDNLTSLGLSLLICNLIYILGFACFSVCRSLATGMALDNIE